jgi:hypothetical protein
VGAGLSFDWVAAPALDLGYWYRRCWAEKVHPTRENQAGFYNFFTNDSAIHPPVVVGC